MAHELSRHDVQPRKRPIIAAQLGAAHGEMRSTLFRLAVVLLLAFAIQFVMNSLHH